MTDHTPLKHSTVAIVGMGLLGGSLALALQDKVAHLIGVVKPGDEYAHSEVSAREMVDELTGLDTAADRANIVVLATPVRTIIEQIGDLAMLVRPGTLITDLGSTKAGVMAAMHEAAGLAGPDTDWIGGHPMAGGTTPGLEDINPHLFEDSVWAVCPEDAHSERAIARVVELITAVGAYPELWDPVAHDAAVALVSHLPFVAARALVRVAADRSTDQLAPPLAARGWQRATQAAAGSADMWTDILATNGANVSGAARELAAQLTEAADRIDAADPTRLRSWLISDS